MKVALVHDGLFVYGGAEKVLEELHALYPDAPVYTSLYEPSMFPERLRKAWDVRTTWMDRIPFSRKVYRAAFPLYPHAFAGMDLDGYDAIISSSFNFAHHVACGPDTAHVCYSHSPARFMWDYHAYARREKFGRMKRLLVESQLPRLRALDRAAGVGVDSWIATSRIVQDRIARVHRRESVIVPPPVDMSAFGPSTDHDGYFLLLMRLVPWKRPDVVVEACTRAGLPLVVAGDGRDERRLRDMAGPTVRFVGRVDGEEKARLYSRCAAFVLPAVEDFGITPLEAMASGRPVIAFGEGGALDTVVPGTTGEFFHAQDAQSLLDVLGSFDPDGYDTRAIREHALRFDRTNFHRRIDGIVRERVAALPSRSSGPVPTERRSTQVAEVRDVA